MDPIISLSVDPTIVEGDSGTKFLVATVTLSGPAPAGGTQGVLVTQNGTATSVGSADFQATAFPFVFPAGLMGPIAINISITGDRIFEPDETFSLHLANPINGTIQNGDATVTILNDDAPLIATLTVDPTIIEGTGGTNFVTALVTLSRPAPVTGSFTFSTQDGTASSVGNADFQAQLITMTFLAGAIGPTTVMIPITPDSILEPNETFSLHLTAVSGVDGFANNDAVVTIINDEPDPLKNDFDSDGHSDILWQNLDGTPVVWLTHGSSNLITASNVGSNPGADC